MNKVSTEEVLNKAYRLAYFLHQDKSLAIRIVAAATLKLNVAMAVQSKRLYYVPVGRFSRGESRRTDGIRNKALFSDLHLLQRLIYGESEPYERQKERAALAGPPGVRADGDPATEEDLLVYFVKHLVRITTKRNAFYVTLGVSRLLHSYSTLETMELYNAVIGEPERVKDDYYYRSRKAVLMHEMYQRFGQLIRACRQRRGEERFETQQGSNEQRSLVRDCLRLFTPWDTHCPVPRDFDPFKTVIAPLTSQNGADENRIEVNRIHAVLHPDCFEKLVAAFGYDTPEERVELPRFFSDQTNDQSPPGPRNAPSELSAEELAEINHMLDEQAGRRRRAASTGAIRVVVDGVERGRLNPVEQSSISFSVKDDAEIIEVKTMDPGGDLLLATHLLTSFGRDADDAAIVSSIRLEGGQDLSLSITRRQTEANGETDLLVKFGYQETNVRRAARLWWQRLRLRFNSDQGLSSRSLLGAGMSARYALAGGVVVICLASYLAYVTLRSRQASEPPPQTNIVQTSRREVQPDKPAVTTEPQIASQPARRTVNGRSVNGRSVNNRSTADKAPAVVDNNSSRAETPAQEDAAEDLTRSNNAVVNLPLREVKKIYIDLRGDSALSESRNKLVESLSTSGVVAGTTDANEADAALRIVVSQSSNGQTSVGQLEASAVLVNARGTVLRSARRYSGETNKVLSDIVNDLLSDIRKARAGQ